MTKPSTVSDHHYIMCNWHFKDLNIHPTQRWKTKWWKLNPENVTCAIVNNNKLMNIFSSMKTETVWNTLIEGLNEVINTIAPTRIIQSKKDYILYVVNKVKQFIDNSQIQLTKAIATNNSEEWKLYKFMRNKVTKENKSAYYKVKLESSGTMW